jgi:hypothetical protein
MSSLPFMSIKPYIKWGLINLGGKSIECGQKILKLLKAEWAPKWVAIMHCWGHTKGENNSFWGNWKDDKEAKWAALTEDKPQPHWQLPCSCVPYLNGIHGILHKNRIGLRLKEEIFYQMDGGSLLMVHCHVWVTGSHICQAVPLRYALRTDSSQDHLGSAFLFLWALQHK